jgi:hypothetical protein
MAWMFCSTDHPLGGSLLPVIGLRQSRISSSIADPIALVSGVEKALCDEFIEFGR